MQGRDDGFKNAMPTLPCQATPARVRRGHDGAALVAQQDGQAIGNHNAASQSALRRDAGIGNDPMRRIFRQDRDRCAMDL